MRLCFAVGKQIIGQYFNCKIALLFCSCFFVHIQRSKHDNGCNLAHCVLVGENRVGINDRCAKRRKYRFIISIFIFNVKHHLFANFLVRQYRQRAKQNKQRNRLFDARYLNVNWKSKPVILAGNHHVDLFRRNAFEIGNRFHFRQPRPFCVSFRNIITKYFIFSRPFLTKNRLFAPINNEITSRIIRALPRFNVINMSILVQNANGRFQHDWHFANVNIRQHLVKRLHIFKLFS